MRTCQTGDVRAQVEVSSIKINYPRGQHMSDAMIDTDAQPERALPAAMEALRNRKRAILGELDELRERRIQVMASHEAATQRHIKAMQRIQDRQRELETQAEHVVAQWEHERAQHPDIKIN